MKAIIFDLNGTLVRSKSGHGMPLNVDDQELIPGVEEILAEIREQFPKAPFLIASNQSGVAFGQLTIKDASDCVNAAIKEIGGTLAVFCPEHADGNVPPYNVESEYRKPKPGMLHLLLAETGIHPHDALVVGDSLEDQEAAIAAEVDFEWADDFFGRVKSDGN